MKDLSKALILMGIGSTILILTLVFAPNVYAGNGVMTMKPLETTTPNLTTVVPNSHVILTNRGYSLLIQGNSKVDEEFVPSQQDLVLPNSDFPGMNTTTYGSPSQDSENDSEGAQGDLRFSMIEGRSGNQTVFFAHHIFVLCNNLGCGMNETQIHWAHSLSVHGDKVELR